MSSMLHGFYEGFIYRKKEGYLFNLDPLIKIIILIVQIISILLSNTLTLLLLFLFSFTEGVINKLGTRIIQGIKGILIPVFLIFVLVSLFQGIWRAFRVILIMLCFFVCFAIFSETTSPLDIVRALEWIGLSIKIAFGFALAIKLIPEISADALDSILSFTLRGEFKSKISLGEVSKVVSALTASSMIKAQYIGESLALKGLTSKNRHSIYSPTLGLGGKARLILYFLILFYWFIPFLLPFSFPSF